MSVALRCRVVALCSLVVPATAVAVIVPQYRVFDLLLSNTNTTVANKFTGVWLNATFVPPVSAAAPAVPRAFWGFHDGGDVWHLRYMPDIVGRWTYKWSFNDSSLAGRSKSPP